MSEKRRLDGTVLKDDVGRRPVEHWRARYEARDDLDVRGHRLGVYVFGFPKIAVHLEIHRFRGFCFFPLTKTASWSR